MIALSGQIPRAELHDTLGGGLGIRQREEAEVPRLAALRRAPRIDGMRGQHDLTALALAENLREADAGNDARAQDILQHGAGPHGRQLVHIAHEDDMAALRHRREEVLHEHDIHHRDFVEDDDIGVQWVVLVPREHATTRTALRFQQAVHSHGLTARCLGHALGRTARGSAEQDGEPLCLQEVDHAAHDGRLARTGAAREHEDAVLQYGDEGLALPCRERNTRFVRPAVDLALRIGHQEWLGLLLDFAQAYRHLLFCPIEIGWIDERFRAYILHEQTTRLQLRMHHRQHLATRDAEQLRGLVGQRPLEDATMAVHGNLLQCIADARRDAAVVLLADA